MRRETWELHVGPNVVDTAARAAADLVFADEDACALP